MQEIFYYIKYWYDYKKLPKCYNIIKLKNSNVIIYKNRN